MLHTLAWVSDETTYFRTSCCMSQLIPLLLLMFVGFAAGYGVRELISRRRRASRRSRPFFQTE